MSADIGNGTGAGIGEALRDARQRLGMDVRQVEERTKIRARYIRALENEDWDSLPAPAYVRGFLRTYGRLLGLDGERLADEYRRRTGGEATASGASSEPVLRESRRPGGRGPSRGLLLGGLGVGLVVVLVILGLLGDSDGGDPGSETGAQERREARQERERRERRRERARERRQEAREEPVETDLTLEAVTFVEVCLVAGDGTVLIDRQTLDPGSVEEFSGRRRYRIDLVGGGELRVRADREGQRVTAAEPVTLEAGPDGIRTVEFRGPDCP